MLVQTVNHKHLIPRIFLSEIQKTNIRLMPCLSIPFSILCLYTSVQPVLNLHVPSNRTPFLCIPAGRNHLKPFCLHTFVHNEARRKVSELRIYEKMMSMVSLFSSLCPLLLFNQYNNILLLQYRSSVYYFIFVTPSEIF